MSLIELMIAMAIGLIMILALSRVYLSSAEGAQEAEARAMLVDKLRFLHERFNYEFRRADFWGRVPADAERLGTLSLSGDCDGEFAFGRSAEADASRPLGLWASRDPPTGCSLQNPLAEQSYLAVRYAAEPCAGQCDTPSLSSFYPYIGFFVGSAPALPERGDENDLWRYGGSLYYLSSDETALRRLWISGGKLVNQEVLRGVEALAYRWCVDDGDGENAWLATDQLTPTDMNRVVAVEIEAVVSTTTRATYRETRSYTLSDGTRVASSPGKMYRDLAFVVPLEMHRLGGGDE